MTTTIDNTKPMYAISDHTLDEKTFRAATEGAYNYYSWLQVYSQAYINEDGEETVNMQRVKLSGIDHNGHFILTLDGNTTTHSAASARVKWNELVRDFGWKANSFNDPKFAALMEDDIDLLRHRLYNQ